MLLAPNVSGMSISKLINPRTQNIILAQIMMRIFNLSDSIATVSR